MPTVWQGLPCPATIRWLMVCIELTTLVVACHVCAGDIFLLDERDIIHTNLSVREGLGEGPLLFGSLACAWMTPQ